MKPLIKPVAALLLCVSLILVTNWTYVAALGPQLDLGARCAK